VLLLVSLIKLQSESSTSSKAKDESCAILIQLATALAVQKSTYMSGVHKF